MPASEKDEGMQDDIGADWYGPDSATFGDRLAGARERLGLTQAELARRVGVKLGTLKAWEDDLSEPRANKLQMLSGLLNVSLAWLLSGEGEGLDGPPDTTRLPPETEAILTEMRQLRADMMRAAERLGRLEKRLNQQLRERS